MLVWPGHAALLVVQGISMLCHIAVWAPCRLTLLSSSVPSAGVTSFMLTTCSSTGGMLAPVPCAPTCMVHIKPLTA